MREEVIDQLPEILKRHITTLKKSSKDDTNEEFLSESLIKVINFDKIPKEYARGKGWRCMPKSNDALYITPDYKWFFIEFKNGSVDRAEVYRKIYDSIIILIELGIIPDFEFVRQNMQYILVYGSDKYSKIPPSENRDLTYGYLMERAEMEEKLFGIDNFEQYLFEETHTYTKSLFEKNFVIPMEHNEECGQVRDT